VNQTDNDPFLEVAGIQFQDLRFSAVNRHRDFLEEFIGSVNDLDFDAESLHGRTYLELWLRTLLRVHPQRGVGMPAVSKGHFANFDSFFKRSKQYLFFKTTSYIHALSEAGWNLSPLEDDSGLVRTPYTQWCEENVAVADALFGRERTNLLGVREELGDHGEATYDDALLWMIVEEYLEKARGDIRSLFSAADGALFGALYVDTQPEDQLWFLYGLDVPVMLRPSEDNRYKLVGDAFVCSYMHGEILKTGWIEENKQHIIIE
jgi:hypothetical protein